MTDQYALPLIEHEHRGVSVPQRAKDGYVNATAMCKAAGKNWADYNRIGPTRAFFNELSAEMGLPISELVQSVSGGTPQLQGTWVHPYVAINLGQWLSPQFSVQVSKWVTEWIAGGPQIVERMPYHLRRYVANMSAVPRTHFSILQELTCGLIAPMEAQGQVTGSEAEHIKRALEAAQTAMDAIQTVTNVASYTLTAIGIVIGLVAIFGGVAIWLGAKAAAKQIANKRFDDYMQGDEFKELVKVRVEQAVDRHWQESAGARLVEERAPDDPQPFEPPPEEPPSPPSQPSPGETAQ